jgi:uncharacterized membrane protein YbhN (UPF0104 family)
MTKTRLLGILGSLVGLVLLVVALGVLRHQLQGVTVADVLSELRALPRIRMWASFVLTIGGYLALGASDLVSLRYLGRKLSLGKTLLTSFVGYAFANNLPFSFLVGAWVRFRFYSEWKRVVGHATSIVFFNILTYCLGLAAAMGLVFTLEPATIPGLLRLPIPSTRPLGLAALTLLAAYLGWSAWGKQVRVRTLKVTPPPISTSLLQIGVSLGDWALSGAALFVLLPDAHRVPVLGFFGVFLLAQLPALIAQVPGGLGVFEAVMVAMLGRQIPIPKLLVALLAYRVIYFLIPLVLATGLLVVNEIARLSRHGFAGRGGAKGKGARR